MGYIGSEPATNFETVRKQVSTTNSGTTITLDYSVSSVQDILVTVNAVVQSYDNYSVSGTTLTLGGTLNNDRVEILYVGRTFQTVSPATASVTNDMLAGSIANSKLANSSITLNGSAVSLGGSATTTIETPYAARMYKGSDQSIANTTQTELDFSSGTLEFNKGSIATLSNGRITVPSGADGFWWLHANARVNNFRAARNIISLVKNGSGVLANVGDVYEKGYMGQTNQYQNVAGAFLVNATAGDYFTARFYQNSGGTDVIWERSFMGWYLGSAT